MDKEINYKELNIYSEVSFMSKELRTSIKQMSRYYRYDVGDEIREMLRQIKYVISDIHQLPNTEIKYNKICDLIDKLNHLDIALTDCIEDEALSLGGPHSIAIPLNRLRSVLEQADKWKNYVYDKYVCKKS